MVTYALFILNVLSLHHIFIASHRSHDTHFSPCNACRTSFHLHAEPHLFRVSPYYLAEHAHFNSINIYTVDTYACPYITFYCCCTSSSPRKGYKTLRIYESDTDTYKLVFLLSLRCSLPYHQQRQHNKRNTASDGFLA